MNFVYNGTKFEMVDLKYVYLQAIPLGMAAISNKFNAGLQSATLIAALCTAILLMLIQWNKYQIARRDNLKQKQEHENHR